MRLDVDWLIHNGRIIDSYNNIDKIGQIAIRDRKIVSIPDGCEIVPRNTIDAHGNLIIPGMIDFHTHFFNGGSIPGLNPDLAYLPAGVTFAIDQGSAGFANIKLHMLQAQHYSIRKKFYLHVSPTGQIFSAHFPEPYVPEKWDREAFQKVIEESKGEIIGLKMRIEKKVVGPCDGKYLIEEAVRLAEDLDLSLCIHVTDPALPLYEVARYLKKGDTLTHIFHGIGHTIFNSKGEIHTEILEGRKRGIVYDVGHGGVNFSPNVAQKAIDLGFYPDSISSDNTRYGWLKPDLGSLPNVMSMFLSFGMPVYSIIKCVTSNPAGTIKLDGVAGTFNKGAYGDVVIMKIIQKDRTFTNSFKEECTGREIFVPQAVILNGELVYMPEDTDISRSASRYGLV